MKILLNVHLKYSSFGPSADVKPMLKYIVHAMPESPCNAWQCMQCLTVHAMPDSACNVWQCMQCLTVHAMPDSACNAGKCMQCQSVHFCSALISMRLIYLASVDENKKLPQNLVSQNRNSPKTTVYFFAKTPTLRRGPMLQNFICC